LQIIINAPVNIRAGRSVIIEGKFVNNQRGFSLIEVLVAMIIISIVFAGLLGAMNGSTRVAVQKDRMDTARVLAEGQMEYVKKQPFSTTYLPDPTTYDSINNEFIYYPGYSATITAAPAVERNANIQKISIGIVCQGSTVATLDDCRVK
jgi:prepilin-type N-terminal cleavage/methylation domain-containing protein